MMPVPNWLIREAKDPALSDAVIKHENCDRLFDLDE